MTSPAPLPGQTLLGTTLDDIWIDELPVCEPLSLEDTRVDVFARPLAETITSAPELEVWRHRDGGAA